MKTKQTNLIEIVIVIVTVIVIVIIIIIVFKAWMKKRKRWEYHP